MTAYLVMKYCESHPTALDEVIVFSKQADSTVGSTAGVRAGEAIRVGDLLFGLMLPSGNDASVALAEHFGTRILIDLHQPVDANPPAAPADSCHPRLSTPKRTNTTQ